MRRSRRPLSERRPTRAQISAEQLASLSHEFRTPLNGVLGMARLLEGTRLTAEQAAYVSALRDSGEHLLTLVNDVLDFAKLGGGRVELRPAALEVETLLRSVAELLSPRAREKGLEIAWGGPALPLVLADEGRLRQILLNFAGNAVKFTEAGGVLISATAPAPGRLRLTVEDTGPGVSESQRDRIFEAFAQAEPTHADLGGAGLGLAIARRLAQAMNGEVGVGGGRHGGAIFWFEAPLPFLPGVTAAGPLAGLDVLVVSPNPVVSEAACQQIRASGGRPATASDIRDSTLRALPAHVVLVDAAFAGADGLLPPPPGRRSIVLIAPDERDRIESHRRAGFAGYLIKPLRRASLAERVLVAAGGSAGATAAPDDERIAEAAAPGARVLLVEDNPINAMLARALLSREGCVVEHAAGGEEALAAAMLGVFDLIFMDMRMPGLSGAETAQRLRSNKVETPIVALTANAFEEDRHACMAAGMDDFLVKPLSPDALRACLTRWTGPSWTKRPARAKVG